MPSKFWIFSKSELVTVFCAFWTFTIGAVAFSGWVLRVPSLRSVIPASHVIPAEVALGLIAASLSLFLQRKNAVHGFRRWLSATCAMFCAAIGGIIAWSLLCEGLHFICIGCALLLLDFETRRGRRPAQILAILSMLAPAQVLLGALYGASPFVALGSPIFLFESTAVLTAAAWILVSLGILCSRPHVGVIAVFTANSLPGRIVRRLLLPALVLPPVLGYLIAHSGSLTQPQASFTASLVALACMVVFVFDLSKNGIELHGVQAERDRAEFEMKRAIASAEEANRAKSNFLANMSHEIRSPVGVMMGFADLIADPDCDDAERAQYIRIMKRNGQALLTIIDDILDLSKVEAEKLKVQWSRLDLIALLNDMATVHGSLARERGIAFQMVFDGPTPQWIISDPVRLRQILANVLGNAIKFTATGSVTLAVRIHSSDEVTRSFQLDFDVTDTGIGMRPEHIAKLFQPFMQGDPSITRQHGGSGLGLALSKRLAKVLSGDLILQDSQPGRGSTFRIQIRAELPDDIPFQEACSAESSVVTPEPLLVGGSGKNRATPLKGLHVLLVDDAADNRTLMKWILNHEGAEVDLACNGREAIEKALLGNYDVILMDLQMPEMDGLTATGRLRDQGYKKPILALTAHAMKEDRDRSLLNGLNDHISKPIQREVLVNKLVEFVHAEVAS